MSEETQLPEAENGFADSIANFEFESSDGKKIDIPLYLEQELLIGRDGNCNWVITDDRVSKQHFRIYSIVYEKTCATIPPLVYCEDLESLNGTYINDVIVGNISRGRTRRLLCDGDLIEIKPFWKFRFHQEIHEPVVRDERELDDLEHFHGRYAVTDRKLGCGKYGKVYLAREVSTAKQVACKIIDFDMAIDKKRAMREVNILAKITHPNIINLRKAFCSHDALYMFTDLASAGDLFSYMQSHGGRLDDYQCRVITRQVALAVQFLHSKNIAHRDIKPENVLVSDTRFGGRAILTDFGFAIQVNTRTGRMMSRLGTYGYIAPEVDAVEEANLGYKKAADLWSLGVLTACLFTGEAVIPRDEPAELSQDEVKDRVSGMVHRRTRPQWLKIPKRARRFILSLLVIDPDLRMTADQALEHSWYSKPPREAEALKAAVERINKDWKQRKINDEVTEALPGVVLKKPPVVKSRYKVLDASASPYFSLDRHLRPTMPSTRKRILEDLNESGAQFITVKDPVTTGRNIATLKGRGASNIKVVEGKDLFGMSIETRTTPQSAPDLEAVDQMSAAPVPLMGKEFEFGPISTNPYFRVRWMHEVPVRKRARKESDGNDRRIHDIAAKTLPRLSTAKALRDAVNEITELA